MTSLSDSQLFEASRTGSKIFSSYQYLYYKTNTFPSQLDSVDPISKTRFLSVIAVNVITKFVYKNRNASSVNEILGQINNNLDLLRLEVVSLINNELLSKNGIVDKVFAVKPLARIIGQNVELELEKKLEFHCNELANLSKKTLVIHKMLSDLFNNQLSNSSVIQMIDYANGNIKQLTDTFLGTYNNFTFQDATNYCSACY